ncbi:hypothetical protein CMUS01_16252 [Colletotrichum musicola]|uniref:Heterokaryon incompatibility domain-containing protein n=1 Tax=Colletotrichum musicola TaxID=2175873 RepID=A0A8H6IQF8_9PEZI|nr:hypothetical protein CMUS01_16252 [Colletotrichum musicola]
MNLCDLCSSINLEDLPPFPDDQFSKTLSGYPRFHHLVKPDFKKGARIERFGVQYHPDLNSLRRAAAEGCVLCAAVEKEAAALAEEIENLPKPRWGITQCDPSWDMWLVRRSEAGGDGLWVVCSSVVDGEGLSCLIPVAAIGFASDEDDTLSAGSSDRVLRQVPDQTTLNRIAAWLKTCDEHPHCRSRASPMPTRLLDVGTSDSDPLIKLVEPDAGLCDRYVTLSYRWGEGARHFTTTSETMQARRTGIEVDALPQTMRDALALTRMLGVRYLWIDSLCICQDDLGEWERESARMAAVYSNSYLTLAASKASDVNGGLLSPRTPRSYFKIPRRGGDGKYILASVLPLDKEVIHDYHAQMRDEPLTKRAWGFQERVLARRVLHFASGQMYWECLEGFQAEEGLRLPRSLQCVSEDAEVTAYARERALAAERENDTGSRRRRRLAEDEAGVELRSWQGMLWEYGPREMTDPADKLPAISGIAKVMSKMLDDEYVAGLWRRHLIRGLCWQGLDCRAVEGYRAPSWSWAAVDGVPATGHIGTLEEIATVLDVQVPIAGENPFGRVRDGVIKLEAPLVRMRVSENKGPTGHVAFRSEKGTEDFYGMLDVIDRSYEASAQMLEEMGVYALVLAFTRASPLRGEWQEEEQSVPTARGLFVTPALDRPGCMRRIGAVVQNADAFAPGELESCRTTVSIV